MSPDLISETGQAFYSNLESLNSKIESKFFPKIQFSKYTSHNILTRFIPYLFNFPKYPVLVSLHSSDIKMGSFEILNSFKCRLYSGSNLQKLAGSLL